MDCIATTNTRTLLLNNLKNYTMKKFRTKGAFLGIFSVLALGTLATACGSDDGGNPYHYDEPQYNIDAAVGTYKGTITYSDLPKDPYYDVIINVTKVDDDHLKITAKAGEEYSAVTEKIIQVEGGYGGDVHSILNDVNGYLSYTSESKSIYISTDDTAATDITYTFEGVKQ